MSNSDSVLVLTAMADRFDAESWQATVAAPEQLAGLFALGDSFHDARRNLAASIAELPIAAEHDAIRVVCLTRKTFPVNELKSAAS